MGASKSSWKYLLAQAKLSILENSLAHQKLSTFDFTAEYVNKLFIATAVEDRNVIAMKQLILCNFKLF